MRIDQQNLSVPRPVGSWIWDAAYFAADATELLAFCGRNGITELYLSVNSDVMDRRYAEFLRRCAAAGIRVSALAGEPNWVYPDKRQDYDRFLERVQNIQTLCGGKGGFAALHLDSNPHSLPEVLENGMECIAGRFCDFVRVVRTGADRLGLALEWDLPFWYESVRDPASGRTLAETVMRLCHSVALLCFRDTAADQLDALRPNLPIAAATGTPFRVACDVLNEDEARRPNGNSRVTYYEEGYLCMYNAIREIDLAIREQATDYGFAVHDLKRWMTLQPGVLPQYRTDASALDIDQFLRCLKASGN